MVASRVDRSKLMGFALERFCCDGLLDGRGSWKMGASPDLEALGVRVGALEELPEASVEVGQEGYSRWMAGTFLFSEMVCPT